MLLLFGLQNKWTLDRPSAKCNCNTYTDCCPLSLLLSIVLGDVLKTVAGASHKGQVGDTNMIKARNEHNGAENE